MTKTHLLAAELYSYSYDNYADHLAVRNVRLTKLMPTDVKKLQRAEAEEWSKERIARQSKIGDEEVDELMECFQAAKKIIFTQNSSETFRQRIEKRPTDSELDPLVVFQSVGRFFSLELLRKELRFSACLQIRTVSTQQEAKSSWPNQGNPCTQTAHPSNFLPKVWPFWRSSGRHLCGARSTSAPAK
jgi:hypothetical protein